MPKKAVELGPLQVSRLRMSGMHAVGTVAGLHLQVTPSGARSWLLKVMVGGRRREMGLGGYPDVTLAMAHQKARAARESIQAGVDPIEQIRKAQSALRADRAKDITFKDAATKYIAAHKAGWRNPKHLQQWTNTLLAYANPVVGFLLVRDIQQGHILKILEPIWTTKTETASRVRSRIELVLDWAKGRGYRNGDNPAAWRGNLDSQLATPGKVVKVKHHPALAIDDISAFMAQLRAADGVGARALEFAVLTTARSGEVRGMTWSEVDIDAGTWVVPAERMKGGREHRIPLSATALKLLCAQPRVEGSDLVFNGTKGMLSDMTLTAVTRRLGSTAVPHGMRSTFRDWAAERTNYPSEMAEMALAHAVGNKVEAAYRRGDLFEKRRKMMAEWAKFISAPHAKGEKVVPIRAA